MARKRALAALALGVWPGHLGTAAVLNRLLLGY